MAIPLAKKLTSEDQKKALPQDWNWTSDSHDLVEDLEQKLKVAIDEELRQRDEKNKEKYEKYEKLLEERKRQNKIKFYLDRTQEELVKAHKRNIANEATVKKQWALFFITHVDHLESILKKGILSPNNADNLGIQLKKISNESIVNTRKGKFVGGKNLADYAHVYFNPKNAFLYSVLEEEKKLGLYTHTKIVIIELTCNVSDMGIYITNKNAATDDFEEFSGLDYHKIIPSIMEDTLPIGRSWSRQPGWANESKAKVMAECLIPDKIPPKHFESIHVYNSDMKKKIYSMLYELPDLEIIVDPSMFFGGGY